ncbi:hypothetical protein HMPREF0201_00471 [Cedecea davisae DSM 4568]|uniref:Uncharacterized protein n=1 Tax=Cedecea davisae DSM 4568 TaxID=566551 RepID=S3J7W0_9ENTR|nr:hypothetical protein HMPREF0201_00471 [Cedecea davisae DSM 4568]
MRKVFISFPEMSKSGRNDTRRKALQTGEDAKSVADERRPR